MGVLPDKSEASMKEGFWFVFPIGDVIVRAWGSSKSGMERIYVDDQLVSEHRKIAVASMHKFSISGQEFSIEFKVISYFRFVLECRLLSGGKVVKAYVAKYSSTRSASLTLINIVFGVVMILMLFTLKAVIWACACVFILWSVVVSRFTKSRFSIEELTEQ